MHRRSPRRVFKRQDILRRWRLPTRRQWTMLTLVLGAVLLMVNILSLWVVTRAKQHVAATLWDLASRPMTEPRGIVLPLFDGIALLGISLILELRAMQIDLPIEIPHCGDLSDKLIEQLEHETLNVHVYDVCVLAAEATEFTSMGKRVPLFCDDVDLCHKRFRSFDIKILSVLFSRFEELMMLDADIMFMQNPMSLWDLDKFVKTGTLFFTDRISFTDDFLAERVKSKNNDETKVELSTRSYLHKFIEDFDRTPFQWLPHVPRVTKSTKDTIKQGHHRPHKTSFRKYEPSEFLRNTHAWNLRAGHHADSSLVLWSKVKQPRATAILASFVTLHHAYRPPSYGDKEFYFLACEVADSEYAFSDFAVGSIGADVRNDGRAVCGDALHFYPIKSAHIKDDNDIPPLYINSDHIATWNPDKEMFYRSNPKLLERYPGSHKEHHLPQECVFDVTAFPLSEREKESFRRRQQFYKTAESWQHKTKTPVSKTQ